MIHLTPHQISSFLDGELAEASAEIVRLHLASCEGCTLTFARAEEQAEQLARVLTHDPGAEYFAGFASDVEGLIRAGQVDPGKPESHKPVSRKPAPRKPAPRMPAPREPEPEVVAVVQPVAEPPAKSLPEPQPGPAAEPRAEPVRSARRRESDRRPVPAIPWYAAAILVVIAGSVGVVVSRSPILPRPAEESPPAPEPTRLEPAPAERSPIETPAPGPAPVAQAPAPPLPAASTSSSEEPTVSAAEVAPPAPKKAAEKEAGPALLVPEPMKTLMPVTRIVTVVETTRTASGSSSRRAVVPPSLPTRAPAAPAEPDPFATLLAELHDRVRAARKASAHAAEDPTALNYEAAASRWEDVVSDLRGHAAQPRARFQLASARYRAWELHPNAQRAAAAVASLRLYLVFAAPGDERTSAKAWLARLSH